MSDLERVRSELVKILRKAQGGSGEMNLGFRGGISRAIEVVQKTREEIEKDYPSPEEAEPSEFDQLVREAAGALRDTISYGGTGEDVVRQIIKATWATPLEEIKRDQRLDRCFDEEEAQAQILHEAVDALTKMQKFDAAAHVMDALNRFKRFDEEAKGSKRIQDTDGVEIRLDLSAFDQSQGPLAEAGDVLSDLGQNIRDREVERGSHLLTCWGGSIVGSYEVREKRE